MTRSKYLELDKKLRRSVIRAVLKFEDALPSRLDEHIGTTKETRFYIIEYRGCDGSSTTLSKDYAVTIKATGQKMVMRHHCATFHDKSSGWTFFDKGLVE